MDFDVIGRILVNDDGTVSITSLTAALAAATAGGTLLGDAIEKVGETIVNAMQAGVAAVVDFATSSIDMAAKHQQIMAQFDQVGKNALQTVEAQAQATEDLTNSTGRMMTVTEGSSKEIAKVGKELDKAKSSLDMSVVSYDSHAKHTATATLSLNQHQAKVAELTAQYDKLTATMQVNADAYQYLGPTIDKHAAALTMTRDELLKLAQAQSLSTTFSRDQQIAAETVLLQYDKIGKDTFPTAMKATADLATRMGVDLPSAALTVAKALGDPVMGIGRLNQTFKLFEPEQLKAIENMAKHGEVAKAQGLILDALNAKIGGASSAAADTYAGKMEILNNKFNDFKIQIGTALLPALQVLEDKLGPLMDKYLPVVADFIETKVVPALADFANGVGEIIDVLDKNPDPLGAFSTVAKASVDKMGKDIKNSVAVSIADIVNNIAVGLAGIVLNWGIHFAQLYLIAQATFMQIVSGVSGWLNTAATNIGTQLNLFITQGEAVIGAIETGVTNKGDEVVMAVTNTVTLMVSQLTNSVNDFRQKGEAFIGSIVTGIKNKVNDVVAEIDQDVQNWEDEFTKKIADFIGLGKNIIDSLVKGIDEQSGQVLAKLMNIVLGAIAKIKSTLGMSSPSKIFMEIGASLPEGMALGIERSGHLPTTAMSNLTQSVIGGSPQYSNQQSNSYQYFFGANTYQPQESNNAGLVQAFRKS